MSDQSSSDVSRPARLKVGEIGPFGLAALSVGAVSPALGLFALWGPMQTATGPVTPLVYLGAALLACPTAISYAVMNREAPSAGAASTWLWRAFSPSIGYLVGLTMLTYFGLNVLAMPVLFSVFFRDLLALFGLPDRGLVTQIGAVLLVTVPAMWAAYRGAHASTRAAVLLMIAESAVVVLLSMSILHAKLATPGAITAAPVDPSAATHGFAGYWAAMLLGILSYCGFDVVSTAAEEANAPREQVPKAIVITIIAVTLFWVLNGWVFTLGIPHEKVVAYTAQGVSSVTPMAQMYWGHGSLAIVLTAFSGIIAVYITMALGTSRIVFALARHRLLPKAFSRLEGPRAVPKKALHAVFAVALICDLVMLSLLGNGITVFTWWANSMVFFATFTFAAVNLANLVYFRRVAPHRRKLIPNVIVPLVGFGMTSYVLGETFFSTLWNAGFTTGRSVVLFSLGLFVIFLIAIGLIALRSPNRLRGAPPMEADVGETVER